MVLKFSTVAYLNLEFYWSVCKKKLEKWLLLSKNVVIGQFSSKCPGLSSRILVSH